MSLGKNIKKYLRRLLEWRTVLIGFLLPLLLLRIALYENKVARAAYGVLIIAIFWVFEVLPLAVTSLLPVLIFPLLGVAKVSKICSSYFKDTLMLFLGSLIVAAAVEKWNLHKRIALRALTLVGPNPRWLMLGIMLPCWFLSMWMSNTATTAMMVPILGAILHVMKESMTREPEEETELVENPENSRVNGTTVVETLEGEEVVVKGRDKDEESRDDELDSTTPNEQFIRLTKTFALCTAFAANIGGMATLTGTPPNIIMKTIADEFFAENGGESGISFANWLIIGLPLSLICLVLTWFWLQVYYSRINCFTTDSESYESVRLYLKRAYNRLGPITFQETVVLIVFIILALLWMTRNPQVVPGWGDLFEKGYTGDSLAAVLITAFLFAFPSQLPCLVKAKKRDEEESTDGVSEMVEPSEEERWKFTPLLDWDTVNQKIPWGVLLLMGGGFAVAEACESSGLSEWVSSELAVVMRNMTTSSAALLLSLMVAAATNVTSNTATATLFLPIVGELAIDLGVHPLSFMIPVAISCSFAFMLPVGTPPNAIVFSTGYLKVKDMVIAGSLVNLVTVFILISAMMLWITPFYNLNEFPEVFTVAKNLTLTALNGTGNMDINSPYNVTI